MKRLILCAVTVLLTSGALATRPAFACTINPQCGGDEDCTITCAVGHHATCNTCTGTCRCI
jgi:hypothetical protein